MMVICDSVKSVWVFQMDMSALSDSTINRLIGFWGDEGITMHGKMVGCSDRASMICGVEAG